MLSKDLSKHEEFVLSLALFMITTIRAKKALDLC